MNKFRLARILAVRHWLKKSRDPDDQMMAEDLEYLLSCVEALQWYADKGNWDLEGMIDGDTGHRARKALAGKEGGGE